MVHALLECWRTLKSGGSLIDLRPLVNRPPIEIITLDQTYRSGYINDDAGKPDDDAANSAVAEVVRRRFFTHQAQHAFQFNLYFNTLNDMETYINEKWSQFAHIPAAAEEKSHQIVSTIKTPYQIRIPEQMHLAHYKALTRI